MIWHFLGWLYWRFWIKPMRQCVKRRLRKQAAGISKDQVREIVQQACKRAEAEVFPHRARRVLVLDAATFGELFPKGAALLNLSAQDEVDRRLMLFHLWAAMSLPRSMVICDRLRLVEKED